MRVEIIPAEAVHLSPNERARLMDGLWQSLASPELRAREQAWAQEPDRRRDPLEAGQLQTREAAAVFSELRPHLRQ